MLAETKTLEDEWHKCYAGGWKAGQTLTQESFAHPAKMSHNLAKRIYEHVITEGWITPGAAGRVIDPFGGIGGTAFHALLNGLEIVTCELEPKFVELSKANRELWRKNFTGLPNFDVDRWTILQGDSRGLSSILDKAKLIVTSPPYGQRTVHHQAGIDWEKAERSTLSEGGQHGAPGASLDQNYGDTEGQLARMPVSDKRLDLAVSSPPYPQPHTSGGGINVDGYSKEWQKNDLRDLVGKRTYQGRGADRADGNLETMDSSGFDTALQSDQLPETYSLVYLLLLEPQDREAAFLKVPVPHRVLDLLARTGMPVLPVAFDDEVSIGNEEVAAVSAGLELATIANLFGVKKHGECVLKIAPATHSIATNGTVDTPAVLQSVRLHLERITTDRALTFNLSGARFTETLRGAILTPASSSTGIGSDNKGVALKAGSGGRQHVGRRGTFRGAEASPLFGVDGRNRKNGGALGTTERDLSTGEVSVSALNRTALPALLDLVRISVERRLANSADGIGTTEDAVDLAELVITSAGAELRLRSGSTHRSLESNSALSANHVEDGRHDGIIPPDNQFEASITSPPYEGSLDHAPGNKNWKEEPSETQAKHGNKGYSGQVQKTTEYGVSENNLGNQRGDDFWGASRLILEQLYQVLAPGSHAVFVVKAFVRGGKIMDFPNQWRQLCEAVGFRLLHDHHALMIERFGTQQGLEVEDDKNLSVSRKSFFRRLHEKRHPETSIDWENVQCFLRP